MPNDEPGKFKPEGECKREMDLLLEHVRGELAVMQSVVDRISKTVYGGNGSPGVGDKLEQRLQSVTDKLETRIGKLERAIWIAAGAFAAIQFFTGAGALTLKGLFGH